MVIAVSSAGASISPQWWQRGYSSSGTISVNRPDEAPLRRQQTAAPRCRAAALRRPAAPAMLVGVHRLFLRPILTFSRPQRSQALRRLLFFPLAGTSKVRDSRG